jgi:phage-related protein (TIGR01555 family)
LFLDTLTNVVAGLFSAKDKLAHDRFGLFFQDRTQLDAAYRGDWIARKVIDVPPFDMTREWRRWHAAPPQIAAIEAEEARLGLQAKIARALRLARLYGGAALVLGAGDADPSQPLPPIGPGALRYLHVMHRWEITPGEIERDVLSPLFGEPAWYQVASAGQSAGGRGRTGQTVRLHPSRVVRLLGAELPDWAAQGADGWGDSVLQAVMDAIRQAGLATQGVAALIHEAKLDVIRIPSLAQSLSTQDYAAKLVDRFTLANTMKGLVNALVIDKEEEWDRKQLSFAQLPEIMQQYLQIAAGAADIPATRLLGQAPAGLNATGEGDIRNYYDRIAAEQRVVLGPALRRLDEALIRSALGERPADIHFDWAPLWQLGAVERAAVTKTKAETTAVYAAGGLIPAMVLGRAVRNQVIEDGLYPGIEAAYAEFDAGEAASERGAAPPETNPSSNPLPQGEGEIRSA